MEDTYRAYYIKEFFKWIGLSYVAVVNKPGRNIFDNEKYLEFDVIVNYNDAIENDQCLKIQERTKNTLISVSDRDERSEEYLLHALLCKIVGSAFNGNSDMLDLLTDIADIYVNEHAVDLIYEYTFILLPEIPENISEEILKRIIDIEKKVEDLIRDNRAWEKNKGLEYALYAMYYSRKQINEFQWIKKRPLIYDTEKYLNEVNEIYRYDEKFFKVESLKAKVAEFDNRFSALPKFFLENAIQDCSINLCKSYHYYTLGKWKERNNELYEASVSYQKSFSEDSTNYKTIFKLAVEQKRLEDNVMVERLFKEIINELSALFAYKEEMPLRKIEYLYKAYISIAGVCEEQIQSQYYEKARECLEYIELMIIEPDKKDFALQLYGSERVKKSIAEAMRLRLGSNIWNCVQGETEENKNEKTDR